MFEVIYISHEYMMYISVLSLFIGGKNGFISTFTYIYIYTYIYIGYEFYHFIKFLSFLKMNNLISDFSLQFVLHWIVHFSHSLSFSFLSFTISHTTHRLCSERFMTHLLELNCKAIWENRCRNYKLISLKCFADYKILSLMESICENEEDYIMFYVLKVLKKIFFSLLLKLFLLFFFTYKYEIIFKWIIMRGE